MVQWVKKLIGVAWVAAETQVLSPAWYSGLKCPVWLASYSVGHSCSLGSTLCLGTSICPGCGLKKKKRERIKTKMLLPSVCKKAQRAPSRTQEEGHNPVTMKNRQFVPTDFLTIFVLWGKIKVKCIMCRCTQCWSYMKRNCLLSKTIITNLAFSANLFIYRVNTNLVTT